MVIEKKLLYLNAVLLLTLLVSTLLTFPTQWDFLDYHLVASLQKFNATTFTPNRETMEIIKGFPPLSHIVQGTLIRLTGHSRFASLLGFVSFVLLLTVFWFETRSLKKLIWATTLFLSVPFLFLHLMTPYIDLWTGVWTGLAIYYAFISFQKGLDTRRGIFLCVSILMASLSKMQAWPLLGVTLFYFFIVWCWRLSRRGTKCDTTSRTVFIATLVVASICLFLWPLRNLLNHSNPTYPWRPPVVSEYLPKSDFKFPIAIDSTLLREQSPEYLLEQPQLVRYIFSVFEIGRFWEPFVSYNSDMFRGKTSVHHRMGGWGMWTVLFLIICFYKRARQQRDFIPVAVGLGFVCLMTGFIHQSHELRYWLGLPIAAILCLVDDVDQTFITHHRRWVYLVLVLTLVSVAGRVKLKYKSLEDAIPLEAQEFWKSANSNQIHEVQNKPPWTIFWAGPDLNTFKVVVEE